MRVMTLGTFDLFHDGHHDLIERCVALAGADPVVVAVNTDEFVTTYKDKPEWNTAKRFAVVDRLLRRVYGQRHRAVINEGPGIALIEDYRPHLVAVGTDWLDNGYCAQIGTTRERLGELGVAVVFLPRHPRGVTTTNLREAA